MASELDPFSRKLNYRCGAPGYTAPEILNDLGYDTQADVFSIGAIMFALLTRRALFKGKDTNEIVLKNKKCCIEPTSKEWCKMNSKARDLLLNLLNQDPSQRFTAAQALDHSWFNDRPMNQQNSSLAINLQNGLKQNPPNWNIRRLYSQVSPTTSTKFDSNRRSISMHHSSKNIIDMIAAKATIL